MPRKPRFNLPGIPQHVIQRGNNRAPCFFAEEDYQRYRKDLVHVANKYRCRVHAYVLMTNHVHLLATPMSAHGISEMMQALGRRYVYYINKKYKRTGTLWEGRFKSSLIDSDRYLLVCMCYIELNPVRAGMVEAPGDYAWSSYLSNAHHVDDGVVQNHPVYTRLGGTGDEQREAYRELFCNPIDNGVIHRIRDTLNHELVLGRSNFKDKIEEVTNRKARQGKPGRPSIEEWSENYIVFG